MSQIAKTFSLVFCEGDLNIDWRSPVFAELTNVLKATAGA